MIKYTTWFNAAVIGVVVVLGTVGGEPSIAASVRRRGRLATVLPRIFTPKSHPLQISPFLPCQLRLVSSARFFRRFKVGFSLVG